MPRLRSAKKQRTSGHSEAGDEKADGLRAEIESQEQQLLEKDKQLEELRQENDSLRLQLQEHKPKSGVRPKDKVITGHPRRLPAICLDRILSFCEIRDVIRGCMTVSKEWKSASETNLKNRKSLKIVYFNAKDEEKQGLNTLVVGKKERKDRIIKSLKQLMGSISDLSVACGDYTLWFFDLMFHFAPSVQNLFWNEGFVRIEQKIEFSRLTRLECVDFSEDVVAASPRLKSLKCNSLLRGLICNQPKMVKMFAPVKGLTELSVKLNSTVYFKPDDVDAAVELLVKQNPGLEKFELKDFEATDKSLVSLSKLENLTSICFTSRFCNFSKDAIVGLLNGPSGEFLVSLTIGHIKHQDEKKAKKEVTDIPSPFPRTYKIRNHILSMTTAFE